MTTTTAILIALLFALVGAAVVLWLRLSTRDAAAREVAAAVRRVEKARRTVIEKTLTVGRAAIPRPRLSTFDEIWNLMESSMLESIRQSTAVRETMEVEREALDLGARVRVLSPDSGEHSFKIPPRTADMTTFRFKRVLSGGRDLYITVRCKSGAKPAN